MDIIIKRIVYEEENIPDRDPFKKIYTHSLVELKRLNRLIKEWASYDKGVYFIAPDLLVTLNRYIERLKKIKTHYYEIEEELEFPSILRYPLIIEGDVIRIKKEIKKPSDTELKKEILHLTFTHCKSKHIEIDNRTIIVVGSNET